MYPEKESSRVATANQRVAKAAQTYLQAHDNAIHLCTMHEPDASRRKQ
jgi:hypothetical protein